jgi:catechol 2,3-dioxygenase-like lactoylglutathione lyase family enzyme
LSRPPFQVTFDAADPPALARFWAAVLGYVEQDPPPGFDTWDAFLDSIGVPADQRDIRAALVDPKGVGPRLFFQKVPEPKTAKNRVHLDVNVGVGRTDRAEHDRVVRARAEELIGLGATKVREDEELGEFWIVLQDPDGNEFCLQ